ncbi:MAG: hypothetical protein QOE83_832 [Actinomycetota bacterium]|jgi:hypothetical protein|nr:hypothetical protein [Actinomycetota bacterium]
MDDLATTLRPIDRNAAPDLWEEISHRVDRVGSAEVPRVGREPGIRPRASRLVTILVALAVGAAGSLFVVRAFDGSTPPSRSSGAGPLQSPAFQQGCDNSVDGNLPPDWKRDAVISGPVAFVWLPNAPLVPASPGREQHAGVSKVLIFVKRGWRVTVSIAQADRGEASLLYAAPTATQGPNGSYRLDQGHDSVTFTACTGGAPSWATATQFAGGVLAVGPMCLHLIVTGTGDGEYSETVAAPLGQAATCSRASTR